MQKPLSPHLSIYKWQITNTLSILHRLSGVALFFSTTIIAIFFVYCYYNNSSVPQNWLENKVIYFFTKVFLISCCVGFAYHISNGVRYLYFDITTNITNKSIKITAYGMLLSAVIVSIFLIWIII